MFPAYTKYEYINRIVVPGLVLSASSAFLWKSNIQLEQLSVFVGVATIPAGYFTDIVRDWLGYGLEKITKKLSFFKYIIPGARKQFKNYFFYLENTYKTSKVDALEINYKFFFDMTSQQRYYFSVRQSWASFTTNMFTIGLLLMIQESVICIQNKNINFLIWLSLFGFTAFFYYAGIYRLIAVSKLYNILLDKYYRENYLK